MPYPFSLGMPRPRQPVRRIYADEPPPDMYAPTQAIDTQGFGPESEPDVDRDFFRPRMNQLSEQMSDMYQPRPVSGKRKFLAALASAFGGPQIGRVITGAAQQGEQLEGLESEFDLLSKMRQLNRQEQIDALGRRNIESQIHGRMMEPQLQAEREAAQQARLEQALTSQEKRAADALAASEARTASQQQAVTDRTTATQTAAEARQAAQFAQQDKLLQTRLDADKAKAEAQKPLPARDAAAAKDKLLKISLAKQQLQNLKNKFQVIKGSGPLASVVSPPGFVFPGGQAFDAAVDAMRQTITSLTRTPGVGAMSDYETRLFQAQLPKRRQHEVVTEQQIQQLDDMFTLIESGYADMLSGSTPGQAGGTVKMRAPNGQFSDVSADQVEHYKSLGATVVQ